MEKQTVLLTKDELISGIAEKSGESKAAVGKVVTAYPQVVVETLLANLPKEDGEISGSVPVPGFGSMAVKFQGEVTRKDNLSKNGGTYTVPAHYVPTFKLSKAVKVALNEDILGKAAEAKKNAAEKSA